jgi:UDP-glucose 6-dehydrogenase
VDNCDVSENGCGASGSLEKMHRIARPSLRKLENVDEKNALRFRIGVQGLTHAHDFHELRAFCVVGLTPAPETDPMQETTAVSLLLAIWSLNPHDHTMEDYCGPIRPKTLAECLV